MKTQAVMLLLALVFSSLAQAGGADSLVTCEQRDPQLRGVSEILSVVQDGGSASLRLTLVSGGRRSHQTLMHDLLCETSKVKGYDSIICFSNTSPDKVILDIDALSAKPYKLLIIAMTERTRENLSRSGLRPSIVDSTLFVEREYFANDCAF